MDAIDDLLRRAWERARQLQTLPTATYRLQFHAGFQFRDAAGIVPYLSALGISHIYASPYLKAVPGSTHGYDVVDQDCLNPELGTQEDYDAFLAVLAAHKMTHILDSVPNHMGVATNENRWWNDVLEHGPASRYAKYFDIAWRESRCASLRDRVLLPVLGDLYSRVLEGGQLKLTFDRASGTYAIEYYERRFPVNPRGRKLISEHGDSLEAFNGKPGDAASYDLMDSLIALQSYRLAFWRVASDEINYRRFFDVTGLAALAMERDEVFRDAHALTLRLAAQGKVAGLRIDHPDGLYDPAQYFRRLQQRFLLACAKEIVGENDNWGETARLILDRLESTPFDAETPLPLYVVVEKILAEGESLPRAWACHGTSGYDFLIKVNGLFIDPAGERELTGIYEGMCGSNDTFEELAYRCKLKILDQSLASELEMLTDQLEHLACADRGGRDFTHAGLHNALREIIACFAVYRSYINSRAIDPTDRAQVESAVARAMNRRPDLATEIFQFVRQMVLQESPRMFNEDDRKAQLRFAGKFQQLTSPVMAKGVEDTAFYIDQRLVSLNEVGGNPGKFGTSVEALHAYLADRQLNWPSALSALSTHDTKRSEDVRAKINVLSELPGEWRECVVGWMKMNEPHRREIDGKRAPSADEEYLFYQTLVGAWSEDVEAGDLEKRITQYMQKAMREAKQHTSWVNPNEAWEKAVENFVQRTLSPEAGGRFLAAFRPFAERISRFGIVNSLAQTLVRLASPGVPDTYQGCELIDLSLVDPDNRRPVDYKKRQHLLADPKTNSKFWLTRQVLHCRRSHPKLFGEGDYQPIESTGEQSDRVFSFSRNYEGESAIIIVPRLVATLRHWDGTRLKIPASLAGDFFNILTEEKIVISSSEMGVGDLLSKFPVGLLLRQKA